jgi:hypothetical protein
MIRLEPKEVEARQFVTRTFVERGSAPTSAEIAQRFGLSAEETAELLRKLVEKKALVLHPRAPEVWVAHPFSNSPNSFWVETLDGKQGWWSNCAWCALGVSALVKRDVRLISRWGGEKEQFAVEVKNGKLSSEDFVVHMALPVARLWDNVIHSCSLMLPHKDEAALEAWCERHRIKKGAVMRASKCYELAEKWYGPYLDPGWNRKSGEEVTDLFRSMGLDLEFRERAA